MRVLVLAPQPFFQERGTPIAVSLLIRALCERGDEVDLLTFHEGEEIEQAGLSIHRIQPWPRWTGIKPGFSWKKVYCDLFLFVRFLQMLRTREYDIVHATEESVFMAKLLCTAMGIRYVYDMDSSMSHQIVDRHPSMEPLRGTFMHIEGSAMRSAEIVVPVCDALAEVAIDQGVESIFVLKDVSLIDPAGAAAPDIREELGWEGRKLVMYIGNLEPYQGIDLLLESFASVREKIDGAGLVIIGGVPRDVEAYRTRVTELGLTDQVALIGQRPVSAIGGYMKQADLLVSPRIQGENTPMKVYTYLDSGVAVLATDLPTHRQVITPEIAGLAAPDPESFGAEMARLLGDPAGRAELASAAKRLIEREHSYEAFRERVTQLYDRLESRETA